MKHAQPRGLSRRRVEQLLSKLNGDRAASSRIEALSRQFLGRPYKPDPLIGSADTPEVFTASLDGFDCVTYIETVLALARASNVSDFIDGLRRIRYEQGRIQWKRRNHYITRWIQNNAGEGIVRPISAPAVPMLTKERLLNVVPGLDQQLMRMKWVPKRAVPRLEPHMHTGDLIFFVSTRKNLDVFHAGIIVRDGRKTLMRHASRSQGGAVEQELRQFLNSNRIAGVIVVRPREVTLTVGAKRRGGR